ncbi:TPA: helix-turn-helix transcriptional regulator [Serratia fonticola]
MIIIDSNYTCDLSKITFVTILESLKNDSETVLHHNENYIAFVDGDSANVHRIVNRVYELRRSGEIVYMITFLSKSRDCSSVVRHLSDHVVDKKIAYADLKALVGLMLDSEPKLLADNTFGDILGDILKSSHKEYRVLKLLLSGYSQYQISQMLNLSIKTVSGYKVKAVKRYGARNFNELYLQKFSNGLPDLQ